MNVVVLTRDDSAIHLRLKQFTSLCQGALTFLLKVITFALL